MSDKDPTQPTPETRLLERIVGLGLTPGDIVPSESELSVLLHSGRPQVRETLRVLEALGTVRTRQGARRVWVGFSPDAFGAHFAAALGPTRDNVEDLYEIRHAFESVHIAQVAARMTPEHEEALRAVVAQMVAAARRGESLAQLDERFHRVLFAPLDNRIHEGLSATFWRLWSTFGSSIPESIEERQRVAAMHARIIDAVSLRDVGLATHELDAHFWGLRRTLRDRSLVPDEA